MDALKTSRKIFRSKIDKSCVEFDAITAPQRIVESDMVGLMDILLEDKEKLDRIEEQMLELMVDAKVADDVLLKEAEAASGYSRKVTTRRAIMNKLLETFKAKRKSAEPKRFKYEKIEFKKYGGELSEWISWWAQFEQVHRDAELTDVEKFHYLSQCMVPDSPAQRIVDSYPQSAANYPKVIDELKRRCGRPELLSVHYVREFIQLAVTRINAKDKSKLSISALYDDIVAKDTAVQSLNITAEKYVEILKTALIESCLPDETLRAWQRVVKDPAKDMYDQLLEFLRSEVDGEKQVEMAHLKFGVGEAGGSARPSSSKKKTVQGDAGENLPTAAGLMSQSDSVNCVFCGKKHESRDCMKARAMSLDDRRKAVMGMKSCYVCLRGKHIAKNCKAKVSCVICGGRHYPILCPENRSSKPVSKESSGRDEKRKPTESTSAEALMQSAYITTGIPLQTLTVNLIGRNKRKVRILLDSGAQRSCILESTAKAVGYRPTGSEKLTHTLFGGSKTPERQHNRYHIELESDNGGYRCHFDCLDQPVICGSVSSVAIQDCAAELKRKNIKLSDCSDCNTDIEVLIGNDVYGKLLTGRVEHLSSGLTALETKLGWVLSGKVKSVTGSYHSSVAMGVTMSLFNDATLADLWSLEGIGIQDSAEQKSSKDMEEEAKKHFLETVQRDQEGRYVVQLPWTVSTDVLPDNRAIAMKRLSTMSKKLRSQGLWQTYNKVFQEWLQNGVIEELGSEDYAGGMTKNRRVDEEFVGAQKNRLGVEKSSGRRHFLPHRAVVKMESATTKVRPVFDASCKAAGSLSLNDCLEKGPNLLELLPSILLRFREKKIGVVSDIRKAFLQVGVAEEHRDFLRFLWWSDENESAVREFRHCRVVFGVNCSPFLLGAVIEHHLQDASVGEEDLRRKLFRSMYVDNCVTSVDGEMDLQRFMAGAVRAFATAQMELVQWEWTQVHYNACNESVALAPELSSVLGMGWDRRKDTLRVKVMPEEDIAVVTKRVILSHLQRLFDPMGFLAPVVVKPKMMLQEAWILKLGWDVPVPDEMKKKFCGWLATLDAVAEIEVPRRFTNCRRDEGSWELHVFCDASESAYAAVAFLRSETLEGTVVQLLLAKSRVSPVKKVTIPRLELLACLIGARIRKFVCDALELDVRTVMWSDSTTAIAWIKRVDNWGVFVNNRVKEIRVLTQPEEWRHVPGELNPADLPSRGCDANELAARRWWEGPAWLKMPEIHWPAKNVDPDEDLVSMERKKTILVSTVAVADELFPGRFSSYQKMLRVVATIVRFGTSTGRKRTGILSSKELNEAELRIFRLVQSEYADKVSKMTNLKLQDGDNGLKTVITKVTESEDQVEFCYPVWLSGESWIVQLLMREIHVKNSHAGVQTCMRILRERFWIPRSRQIFRRIVGSCTTCRRFTAKGVQEQDVPLPKERVMAISVFQVIGVDLAGPLFLKDGSKCWIVLFTCAVYRAVHLEVVTSISTEAFLRAFRRFISRRGRPSTVFSDQGTNFVGVANVLKGVDWNAVKERYGSERIDWKLNPPASPWWGGFWERLVRVVKGLLVRVLGRNTVDLDELSTVLCEVESIVNARPLTYVSEDGDDLLALTPDMFIKGVRSGGLPELKEVTGKDLLKRHKYQVKLMEDFQSRFRNEYLSTLVQRAKEQGHGEIKIGSVVLIGSEEKKRLMWPLGRVIEVYPGGDGKVRVVKLKTVNGTLIRPVQKLYPLVPELSEEEVVTMETEQEVHCPDSKPEVKTRSGRLIKIPARYVP